MREQFYIYLNFLFVEYLKFLLQFTEIVGIFIKLLKGHGNSFTQQ